MSKPLVVYIAGYGRSGSTVLDVALGATCGNSVSLGEAISLPRSAKRERLGCSCGRHYKDCNVWGDCLDSSNVSESEWPAISRSDWVVPIKASSKGTYSEFWRGVLESRLGVEGQELADICQTRRDIAIDSSKTIFCTARRPKNLVDLDVADVFVVHVKRPLSGIIASRRKGRNVELARHKKVCKGSIMEKIFGMIWYVVVPVHALLSDVFASRLTRTEGFAGYMCVSFDRIVRSPEAVAIDIWKQVSTAMGRDLVIQSPVDNRVSVNHVVEGNRVLQDPRGVKIRPEPAVAKMQLGE